MKDKLIEEYLKLRKLIQDIEKEDSINDNSDIIHQKYTRTLNILYPKFEDVIKKLSVVLQDEFNKPKL